MLIGKVSKLVGYRLQTAFHRLMTAMFVSEKSNAL